MSDHKLAKTALSVMRDHEVEWVASIEDEGRVDVPFCKSCAYLGNQEDPGLHAVNVMLEYVEGYYDERDGL